MDPATGTARFLRFLGGAEETDLLSAATTKVFDSDQVVVDQNVVARKIFLIDSGSVGVERLDLGHAVPLAILGVGDIFGEMSFIDGAPTSARVVALEPTRIRMIDEASVDDLTRIDPGFAGRLYRSIAAILVEWLRRTSLSVTLENLHV
jgi:CRP-like cAMP-binding protein